ncbi:hypothetical protein MMC30_004119 [Trapelia coarctata]|nr:hypothetical protein [Trapelia coarctata]
MSLDEWNSLGSFLRSRPAVESLVVEASIGLALSLPGDEAQKLIRLIIRTISPAANIHELIWTVTYNITWELATVLEKVWSEKRGFSEEGDPGPGPPEKPSGLDSKSIKEVLVINGNAFNAQVTTCEEYISEHWKSALPLLDALDKSEYHPAKDGTKIHISGNIERVEDEHSLRVTVEDTLHNQGDIASAFAWLTASIRYTETDELLESSASILWHRPIPDLAFRIRCHALRKFDLQKPPCWHQLFAAKALVDISGYPDSGSPSLEIKLRQRTKVIATAYPTSERGDGWGLEIPHNLIVKLSFLRARRLQRESLIARDGVVDCSREQVLGGRMFLATPRAFLDGEKDQRGSKAAVQYYKQPAGGYEGQEFCYGLGFRPFVGRKLEYSEYASDEPRDDLISRRTFLG